MINKVDAEPSAAVVLSAALREEAMSVEVYRGGRRYLIVNDQLMIRQGNQHVEEVLGVRVRATLTPLR